MASQEITLTQLQDGILGLLAKGVDDYNPLFTILAQAVRQETLLEVFNRECSPDGIPWPKLKYRQGMILQDTGKMRASITTKGAAQYVEERTRTSLKIGTAVPYAQYHQFGTRRIPKREFLGFSTQLVDRIEELTGDWIEKKLLEVFPE